VWHSQAAPRCSAYQEFTRGTLILSQGTYVFKLLTAWETAPLPGAAGPLPLAQHVGDVRRQR